jgi:hypothetical protein
MSGTGGNQTMPDFERLTIDAVNQIVTIGDADFAKLPAPTQAHIVASVECGGHWKRETFRCVFVNTLMPTVFTEVWIGTRLHHADLAGIIELDGDYEFIRLPMTYDDLSRSHLEGLVASLKAAQAEAFAKIDWSTGT